MGILADALVIALGGLFGSWLQKKTDNGTYSVLGIGIMIVSLVGFIENMYYVKGESISSENLLVVLFCYILGSKLGEWLRLEDRLSNIGKSDNTARNAVIDAALFFGVGGLQISGPLALAIHGDNSQLFIKSMVDIPFAITFGAVYGRVTALSAIPVAVVQLLIAGAAYLTADLFSNEMVTQLCAIGYILLFFSGFNLMTDGKHRISNINMLPGMVLVIVYHLLTGLTERIV